MGHDIGHPGLTNNYQVNAKTNMALTYNDISCLENFHACKLFTVAKMPENNIFEKITNDDYKLIRKRIIPMILATDMFNHKKVMDCIYNTIKDINDADGSSFIYNKDKIISEKDSQELNQKIDSFFKKFDEKDEKSAKSKHDNQQAFLDYFIHAADLAHNTKSFKLSIKWVELLSEEFWKEGDIEKQMGLPVNDLCDRQRTDVPKSQVGFIKFMIVPTFIDMVNVFHSLMYMIDNAESNKDIWANIQQQNRKRGWTPPKINSNDSTKLNSGNKLKDNKIVCKGNLNKSLSKSTEIKKIYKSYNLFNAKNKISKMSSNFFKKKIFDNSHSNI